MMDFDEWVLTINPRYKPTDDSPLTRYLRRTWAAATEQQAAEVERLRAELAECRDALAKIGPYYVPSTELSDDEVNAMYAMIDTARKGEGE